jgi:hypothetical protein
MKRRWRVILLRAKGEILGTVRRGGGQGGRSGSVRSGRNPARPDHGAGTSLSDARWRTALQRASARLASRAERDAASWPWLQITNVWRKRTSRAGGPLRLRGMTTIVRKSYAGGRCYLLGELIQDTAHRYYYRRHVGAKLAFVVGKSPAIHLTPCPACPDWPADQQRGSAVRTNSR